MKNNNFHGNLRRMMLGQSMTEYTIVLVFGVLVLTTGPSGDTMKKLADVMRKNYAGYSYAISLSEPPDYDSVDKYKAVLKANGLSDNEISMLAVKTSDLYTDIKTYNKDPTAQLKKLKEIQNTISQLPGSVSNVVGGATSFF